MATGYEVRIITLLDAQDVSANGPWRAVGRLLSPTVCIQGLEAGGNVSIRVSNRLEKLADGTPNFPADDDLGVPHALLGNVTADMAGGLGGAVTFIRAIKTQGPDPVSNTTVTLQAQQAK